MQSAVLGAVLFVWQGDTSTLAVALPAGLLEARYSRAAEAEADAYASQRLAANRLSPERLVEMLEKLSKAVPGPDAGGALGYLASHPSTADRIAALKRAP